MSVENKVALAAAEILEFTDSKGMPSSFALAALSVAYARAAYLSGTRLVRALEIIITTLDATLDR